MYTVWDCCADPSLRKPLQFQIGQIDIRREIVATRSLSNLLRILTSVPDRTGQTIFLIRQSISQQQIYKFPRILLLAVLFFSLVSRQGKFSFFLRGGRDRNARRG